MISEKAVEAAFNALADQVATHAEPHHMHAALSAALPLLLEDYLAQAWFAGATMMGTNNPSGTTTVMDNAKAYADRILAIMGGDE